MNPFYNHTSGVPVSQSRGVSSSIRAELDLVGAGFDTANTAINLKAPSASPALTGTPTAPTATPLTNTTQIATTAYTDAAVGVETDRAVAAEGAETARAVAAEALKANAANAALTGIPTAPTAANGTNTTQLATTAFVQAAAFASVLPSQTGNAGKFVTTDGTTASWADAVTLTGTQTLTNKTIALGSNTVSGTFAEFNAACTDADFAFAFPSGTAMLFAQTAAPTGWTKSTTHNDKALRVVSGTASSGGSVAFATAFASKTPAGTISGTVTVGATTLSTAEMPAHTHTTTSSEAGGGSGNINSTASTDGTVTSGSTGGGGSHTHTGSMSATFSGTAINFAVQYVDVIICTKD